jgi:GT2 family glycosyltransferase
MNSAFPTTIIVPLYGDLPSAERCVRSVLETVDLAFHRLLLVNDCGPDADQIENRMLELIDGVAGAEYVRNPRNLGFVGTCNRAALELDRTDNDILLLNSDAALSAGALDEMSIVLHLSEKHGVATARSNHATIATIPIRPMGGGEASSQRSRQVFDAVSPELPRYAVVPVAHGFCFLVRRSLIRNYGLFDEAFAPGYGEENDFCLRVNNYGYSSVMANRAYAHHEGEKSFASLERQAIQDAHERKLVRRYVYYPDAVRHYLTDSIDPIDWFADLLVPDDRPRRVLIDLHHMSLIYDGSVRNALTFLAHLQAERDSGRLEGLEFVVAASEDALRFFQLSRFGFRAVANHELDELFDLGFALAPVTAEGQILRLNRLCVRWIASHLDIIALRVLPLVETEYGRRQIVFDSLRYADRVITISEATLDDTLDYFPALGSEFRERVTVIHQGVAEDSLRSPGEAFDHHHVLSDRQSAVVREGGYVLVIGNAFRHKQIGEALAALRGGPWKVVAFGSRAQDDDDNIVPIAGGFLSDSDVGTLYENAAIIVYPSTYEGFGLPIAEAALHAKPVIVFDTAVAREVIEALGMGSTADYFSDFRDLPDIVSGVLSRTPVSSAPAVRSIEQYNRGIVDVIRQVLEQPIVLERIRERQRYFGAIRNYGEATRKYLERRLARRSVRIAAAAADRLDFLRPMIQQARRSLRRRRDDETD